MHRSLIGTGLCAATLALLWLVAPAGAAVLWDEFDNPPVTDLPNTTYDAGAQAFSGPAPQNLGVLTPGVHTVAGFSTITGTDFSTADWDGFVFTIPVGLELAEWNVNLNGRMFVRLTNGTGAPLNNFVSGDPVFNTTSNANFDVDLLQQVGGDSWFTLGPGTYGVLARNGRGGGITVNHTYTFTVTPEPASLLLCAAGAVVMAGRRRR